MSANKKENKNELEIIRDTGYKLAQILYKNYPAEFKSPEDLTKKFGWKMLNYISSNNKERFIEYLYRIYWSHKINLEKGVFDILNTGKFKKYALAFMSGFISKREEDKKSQNKEEPNE